MADQQERIKLAAIWQNTTTKQSIKYLSSNFVKPSQEEWDTMMLWFGETRAVKFQVWPNKEKREAKHPDAYLYMIRGDVEGGSNET